MRLTIALSMFIMVAFPGYSQEINDKVVNAFSASYVSEASKDYDKAVKEIKAIYNEKSYETNLRLGWLSYEQKNYEQSIIYYKLALKLKPNSIEAMLGYAYPASALEKWDELFATYQKILSIDPNHSIVNYRVALMYYYRKEFASAEKQLQKVNERYPFDFDSVLLMAQVKLALGKITESKLYYSRALLYNPSNEEIKKVLSKL